MRSARGSRARSITSSHTRLEWWRGELSQHTGGAARHPLLRALTAAQLPAERLELQPLLTAATIDLAEGLLNAGRGESLRRASFVLAARALGATDLTPVQCEALGALGALTLQHERAASAAAAGAAGPAMQSELERLGSALQPTVAPLLVWAALAAAQARRRGSAPASKSRSLRDGFTDNMRAWSTARRAAHGTLRLR